MKTNNAIFTKVRPTLNCRFRILHFEALLVLLCKVATRVYLQELSRACLPFLAPIRKSLFLSLVTSLHSKRMTHGVVCMSV